MGFKQRGIDFGNGGSRKTPRRMRGEHKAIRKSRYKGDNLQEKINDVEDRIGFLHEASFSESKPASARKQKKRNVAVKKLEKRLAQYRSEQKGR